MDADENYIRRLAQQIWESEGRPENQALRHWLMAKQLAKNHPDDKQATPLNDQNSGN